MWWLGPACRWQFTGLSTPRSTPVCRPRPSRWAARSRTSRRKRARRPTSPSRGVEQRVYYDAGVGTGGVLDRILGGAFGRGLSANTLAAYRFLSQFYRPGDNIYVF